MTDQDLRRFQFPDHLQHRFDIVFATVFLDIAGLKAILDENAHSIRTIDL